MDNKLLQALVTLFVGLSVILATFVPSLDLESVAASTWPLWLLRVVGTGLLSTGVGLLAKHILGGTVEEFARRRDSAAKKFEKEDRKCKELRILSVSAGKVLDALRKDSSVLFDALSRRGANLQLLVVDPTSDAARLRAKQDRPTKPEKAAERIRNAFLQIENVYEFLHNKANGDANWGHLEVRMTPLSPEISLNIYDDKTAVFGLYLHGQYGDETPAFKVTQRRHRDKFQRLSKHFESHWFRAPEKQTLMEIGRDMDFFNKDLFDSVKDNLPHRPQTQPD